MIRLDLYLIRLGLYFDGEMGWFWRLDGRGSLGRKGWFWIRVG